MLDNFHVIYQNLPTKIRGFVVYNSCDDWYTVVLNPRMSFEQNVKTFWHELKHITNDDFNSSLSVDLIEQLVHNN